MRRTRDLPWAGLLWLAAALCCLLAGWLATEAGRASVPTEDYELKIEAAERAQRCYDAIRQLRLDRGETIDRTSDVNGTGLIGPDFSFITTTLGNLEAKRTSTNPNMAAMLVDMMTELGLRPGDTVAANFSGSFPALNIAAVCAMETLGLEPVLMSSFGASTHGANDPALTYQDMEAYLYDQGLISTRSRYYSIGGNRDIGTEMDPAVKDGIVQRLTGLGYELWYDEDIVHNVRARHDFYRAQGDIRCFINVGGNDVSFGDSSSMVHTDGGILTELAVNDHTVGLIQLFLADKVPVIHLLNVKQLAADYGLPIDPVPLPAVGEGDVYRDDRYPKLPGLLALATALPMVAVGGRKLKKDPRSKKPI